MSDLTERLRSAASCYEQPNSRIHSARSAELLREAAERIEAADRLADACPPFVNTVAAAKDHAQRAKRGGKDECSCHYCTITRALAVYRSLQGDTE